MTHRLATNYAKNYCNWTLIVKVIVENVVTCFLGHGVLYILYTIVVLPCDDKRPDKGQVRSTGINSGGTGGTKWFTVNTQLYHDPLPDSYLLHCV